jgi:hypothetical protein
VSESCLSNFTFLSHQSHETDFNQTSSDPPIVDPENGDDDDNGNGNGNGNDNGNFNSTSSDKTIPSNGIG